MVRVDIWSDLLCPFCYIGKRRLENVAAQENISLDLVWHSFELNPQAPQSYGISMVQLIAEKYGLTQQQAIRNSEQVAALAASEGIDFNWQQAKPGNSFNAHRLCHFALTQGKGTLAQELFFQAYMTQGELISDPLVIAGIARELELPAQEVEQIMSGDAYASTVRHDEAEARHMNLQGVPFFIFNGQFTLSGAQPRDVFRDCLQQSTISTKAPPQAGAPCEDGVCAVPLEKKQLEI